MIDGNDSVDHEEPELSQTPLKVGGRQTLHFKSVQGYIHLSTLI